MSKKITHKYKITSLFSGCGGLDLGFIGGFDFQGQYFDKNRTQVVFANDFDNDAATCYNSNELLCGMGDAKCLLADIRTVDTNEIPDYDILLAGFPCQPFSNAGNRKCVNDKNGRGTLFERAKQILINTEQKEYLLVKNFYIVFEAIIDELVGDNPLPDGMDKKQDDGKIVDHLYTAKSLIEQENRSTYYIGDSKYYKIGHALTEESVYKQYTYARNVIQKNLDLFNSGKVPSGIHLRDNVTEGYDIVPNFFISATMNENLNYSEPDLTATDRARKKHKKVHFENRLFDRDTLLLYHYDVNFLFVLSLYARNNAAQKALWKAKIRERFTEEIRNWLQEDFDFFAMTSRPGVNAEEFIKSNFKMVLGKIYQPYDNPKYFSLALEKTFEQENSEVRNELEKYFIIEKISLGESPDARLSSALEEAKFKIEPADKSGVLMVMMENYETRRASFVPSGKIAIALRVYNKGYLEIVEHLNDFHTSFSIIEALQDSICSSSTLVELSRRMRLLIPIRTLT